MLAGWAPPFGVCIRRAALEARQFRQTTELTPNRIKNY